ncbi:MAG TPA: hypothetical protein VKS79_26385 [Gemmataceae bacterium]|nr:hypothetical protein [Gemmataceae bacterium]
MEASTSGFVRPRHGQMYRRCIADVAAVRGFVSLSKLPDRQSFSAAEPRLRPPRKRRSTAPLISKAITEADNDFFINQDFYLSSILGNDYYVTNEHLLLPDYTTIASGEFVGYYLIAEQHCDRYCLLLMHTGTNVRNERGAVHAFGMSGTRSCACARTARRLSASPGPASRIKSTGTALREARNRVHPMGLYDLDRRQRKVGAEYHQLIEERREFLPAGTAPLMLL